MRPGWGAASLASVLDRCAADRPDDVMLVDPQLKPVTYGELRDLAGRAAANLRARGVGRGDRVLTLCQNQTAFIATAFGAWRVGAILVPINPEQRGAILANWIRDADPALVLFDEVGGKSWASLSAVPSCATCGIGDLLIGGGEGVEAQYDADAPAMILFSSGTTGISKGCVLAHGHLVWWGEDFCRASDLGPSDVIYSPGPLFHINAWWAFTASIVNGTRHAFDVRFSASQFWRRAETVGATVFDYVGVIVTILLRREERPSPGSKLRVGMGGAARMEEVREFQEKFGIALLECYGLTECCLPIFHRQREFRLGAIGLLSDHFDARLVDDDGRTVAQGAPGELLLRPHSKRYIFDGYWRRPDLTAQAFSDGWFRTGDICQVDQDGYYYYLDRKRNFIRRRGENISPFELEGLLFEHPAVGNAAVIGVPAELGEEDVLLAVQPKDGATIDPAELIRWCADRMAPYMVPRYVRVMRLPLTPSERVERQKLRDEGTPAGTFDAQTRRLNA